MRISRRRSHEARGDGRAMTSVASIRERYRTAMSQAIPSSDPAWGDTWAHWLEDVGVLLEAIRQGDEELRLERDEARCEAARLEEVDLVDAAHTIVALRREIKAARKALGEWSKHEVGQSLVDAINNLRQAQMTAMEHAESTRREAEAAKTAITEVRESAAKYYDQMARDYIKDVIDECDRLAEAARKELEQRYMELVVRKAAAPANETRIAREQYGALQDDFRVLADERDCLAEALRTVGLEHHYYDEHASDGFGQTFEECTEMTCVRIRGTLGGAPFIMDDAPAFRAALALGAVRGAQP